MSAEGTSQQVASRDDEELEALLAYRERGEVAADESESSAEAASAMSEAPIGISERAKQLIIEYETGGKAYYEQKYKSRAVWPKGSSGITIGCGYDLGYVSEATFGSDWSALLAALTPAQKAALTACVGFHSGKQPADKMQALLATVQDIVIPWDMALAVFEARTLPSFAGLTARSLPNCADLNGDCFGMLVSLTFNRGASYSKAHDPAKDPRDRYREMRAIKGLMAQRDFAGIPDQIRAMIRIWVGTDIEKGMRRRRTDEANLFAEGLASEALAGPEGPSGGATLQGAELGSGASFMLSGEMPAGAQSWDGPGDEDFWEDVGEDDIAAAALENVVPGARRAGASWAADEVQPDYSHLGANLPRGGAFALKAEDLALLAKANDFNVAVLGEDTPVLFALRGAGIVKDHSNPAGIVLIDQRPDHASPRCVMGVWNRRTGKVSVFPGSTVPNQAAVAKYKATRESGNLLATGFYHYICGAHTTQNQSTPGAFLLRNPDGTKRVVIVRRTVDDLSYERGDIVHPCAPGDNIHPTFFTNMSGFSSFGCQTVVGTHRNNTHQGPWSKFREAAGFTDHDGVPGKRFVYMLLTGAEARLAAQLRADGLTQDRIALRRLRRLRFGSQGPAVRRLQEKLGLPDPDGSLGRNTAESLHQRQKALGNPAGSDGIYSPALDEQLGWDVLASG
ncbi:MAG TPA: hypothetical protein VGB54_09975 [Allosphingosinicella sp.]